jgi:hypothetical protein
VIYRLNIQAFFCENFVKNFRNRISDVIYISEDKYYFWHCQLLQLVFVTETYGFLCGRSSNTLCYCSAASTEILKCKFNVFHVRALYYTKTIITNKCTKSFTITCNTLLHVSTWLGHLQGELFVTVTLRLHFIVEWECAVDCVLRCFWRRELSAVPACRPQRVHASSTQYAVNSTFSFNYKVQP